MAKKKKETIDELEYYYHKTEPMLFVSLKYVYELNVYLYEEYSRQQVEYKETSIKEFNGFGETKKIHKGGKNYLQFVQLIGAPLEFLEAKKYKKINKTKR